jgi:hypothetical protein
LGQVLPDGAEPCVILGNAERNGCRIEHRLLRLPVPFRVKGLLELVQGEVEPIRIAANDVSHVGERFRLVLQGWSEAEAVKTLLEAGKPPLNHTVEAVVSPRLPLEVWRDDPPEALARPDAGLGRDPEG